MKSGVTQKSKGAKVAMHRMIRVENRATKDPDARGLKKGKRPYVGYKRFISVTQGDGYIPRTGPVRMCLTGQTVAIYSRHSKSGTIDRQRILMHRQRSTFDGP